MPDKIKKSEHLKESGKRVKPWQRQDNSEKLLRLRKKMERQNRKNGRRAKRP